MADNVTQKSPKSVDKSKFCNVIHRTTSETLRLGETDTGVNNSNLLTTTSSGTPTALAGCNQRKKPCSSFQITSVIVGRMNNDGGDDSADDLDESHADDISDVVDNSRITDNETPSYSEDTYSKEDVFFNVSNSSLCSAPVIPTSSQYGLAIVSPGAHNNVVAGTVTAVNNNILNTNNNNNVPVNVANIDSNLTIMNHSSELDASVNPTKLHEPAEIEDMQAKPGRNDRFKVVKIESTEPFKRGRWMCMDYLDHTINTQFVQQPIVSSKNESIVHPTVQYVSGTTDSNNSTASVESTMQRQQQQPQMQHQVAAQQQSTKSMPVQQMQQQQAQTPYYQQQSQSGVVSSQPPVAQYPQQQYVQQQTQVVTQQQRAVQQTQPQQYAQQQQPQHVPQQQHVQQQHVQQQQQHVQQQQQYVQQPQHNVVQQQQLVQPQVIAQPQQTHVQQQVPIQQHAQQPHMQQNVPQHQMQQQQMTNKAREQTQPQSNAQMGMVQPAMIPSQTSTSSTSIYNPGQSYTPAQQQQPYISQSYTGQQQMYGSNIQGQSTQVSTSGQSYSGLQSYSQGQSCSNVPTQGQSYLPTQGQSYSGQPTVPAQVQSFPSQAQSYSQPYIPLSQPTTQGYVAQKGSLSTPVYSQPNIGSQSQTYTVSMPSSPASIPHQPVYPTTTIANQSQTYIQQKPSGQSQPNATNSQYANQAYSVQYSASQPGLSTSQSYVHVPQHSHSAVNTSAYGTPQYKTTPADGPSPSDTQQHQVEPGVETPSAADDTALVPVTEETDAAASSNAVAIDNKIEQAMDLVKSHLMFAVREEVEVLKERIAELMDRINQLETENSILKAHASQEVLAQLTMPTSQTYNIQPNVVPAVVSAGAAVAAVAAVAVSAAQIVSVPSPGQAPPTN